MAYAPITKIEKFTGEENDTQVWLNDVEKPLQPINRIIPEPCKPSHTFFRILPTHGIKKPVETPLFSGVILESKLITAIYINAKVDGQHIKLILNSGSTGSIITQQLID
ncbi:hypothetical protein G9A89_018800 [Geosiphon pyriformis]|nr:hypothetical protein G9A89_018800 [Geosiphon pyriformis]